MGKFRKMLAGVLSAAMVLSTMTVTAFAETSTTTPATIDTTKQDLLQFINMNIMNRVEKLAQEKQQM